MYIGEYQAASIYENIGTWSATNLSLSESGRLTGAITFNVANPGPSVPFSQTQTAIAATPDPTPLPTPFGTPAPTPVPTPHPLPYQDLLFVQVVGTYIWPQYGDLMHQPIGEFAVGYPATTTDDVVTFALDLDLPLPPTLSETDGGMPLYYVELKLQWTRAFTPPPSGERMVQTLAVLALDYDGNGRTLHYGGPAVSAEGYLGSLMSSVEGYWEWIDENVTLPPLPDSYPTLPGPGTEPHNSGYPSPSSTWTAESYP